MMDGWIVMFTLFSKILQNISKRWQNVFAYFHSQCQQKLPKWAKLVIIVSNNSNYSIITISVVRRCHDGVRNLKASQSRKHVSLKNLWPFLSTSI